MAVVAVRWAGWTLELVDEPYLPTSSDELAYFLNARGMAETGSPGAVLVVNARDSAVGAFGPHGPAPTLLHGAVAKVVGFRWAAIPVLNVAFVALAVALAAFALRRRPGWAAFAVLALLLAGSTPLFAFSYFQESIGILVAVAAALALAAACNATEPRDRRRAVAAFLVAVAVGVVFRPTWAIALIALVALPGSRRRSLAFVVGGGLVAAVYLALFYGHYPDSAATAIGAAFDENGLLGIVDERLDHVWLIFELSWAELGDVAEAHHWAKYLVLGLLIVLLVSGHRHGRPLRTASGLILAALVLALLFGYTTAGETGSRMLGPLLAFGIVVLAVERLVWPAAATLVALALLTPATMSAVQTSIDGHAGAGADYARARTGLVASFGAMGPALRCESRATVLTASDVITNGVVVASLPLEGTDACRVRYSFNFPGEHGAKPPPGMYAEYVLAPAGRAVGDLPVVFEDERLRLMRVRSARDLEPLAGCHDLQNC